MEFAIRALLSGLIVAAIAIIGRKLPAAAAVIASLPIISVLGMVWLWRDTADSKLLADHTEATFFFVLPSLPMFLLIPWLLRNGVGFWIALMAGIALTLSLYWATAMLAARFGVRI